MNSCEVANHRLKLHWYSDTPPSRRRKTFKYQIWHEKTQYISGIISLARGRELNLLCGEMWDIRWRRTVPRRARTMEARPCCAANRIIQVPGNVVQLHPLAQLPQLRACKLSYGTISLFKLNRGSWRAKIEPAAVCTVKSSDVVLVQRWYVIPATSQTQPEPGGELVFIQRSLNAMCRN